MRHQSVSINNTRSSSEFITAGVHQGSVLGPMLFLIYINDISEALSGIARLFADDTCLSFSSAGPAEIERLRMDNIILKIVQLNAARIVTGLPIFASLNLLYYETGWDTPAERRKYEKLNLMYQIGNNEFPSYLSDLLPKRVDQAANYNLRNSENFQKPFSRLCSFDSSFFQLHLDFGMILIYQSVTLQLLWNSKRN